MITGVTSAGFKIKRLPQIKQTIEAKLADSLGQIDTRPESVFGQQVGIHSEIQALLWQLAQDVYNSQYPATASGVSLDYAVGINGVTRIPATPTQVTAICYGVNNTSLPVGREVSNRETDEVYRSTQSATISRLNAVYAVVEVDVVAATEYTVNIGALSYSYTAISSDNAGAIIQGLFDAMSAAPFTRSRVGDTLIIEVETATNFSVTNELNITEVGTPVPFAAIDAGARLLPINSLTEIATPVAGWDRVDNLEPGATGRERETDEQLRIRHGKSISITATNTQDALLSRLREVPLVLDVRIEINNGDVVDGFGTKPQHTWVIIEGGVDADIAQVLYDVTAGGIGSRGLVETLITSPISGRDFLIKFDRPEYIDPSIIIEYTRLTGFPLDGGDQIKQALVAFGEKLTIGQDLIYSRLYTPINTVNGVQVDSLLLNGATLNILASPNEKIRLIDTNITLVDVT